LGSRIRLELIAKKEGSNEVVGPFNSNLLLSFLQNKYSSESGEVKFSNSEEASDLCHELIDLCKSISFPKESDDVGAHDAMIDLSAISSIYVNLQRIKPKNKRMNGYSLRWG
jgi:hypothetical protein